jgi:hypothetical protein
VVTETETAGATWALYRRSWLPCRVLDEDLQTRTLEVRVTDRTGSHEMWVRAEHVRGYVSGSVRDAARTGADARTQGLGVS